MGAGYRPVVTCVTPGSPRGKFQSLLCHEEDNMKAFVAALVMIGAVSVIAALALDSFENSSESRNTSSSVRLN